MADARSEAATPRRLALARARGNVAVSPELSASLAVLGALAVLVHFSGTAFAGIQTSLYAALACAADPGAPCAAFTSSLHELARAVVPLLIVPALCGALAGFLQVGPLVAPARLEPDVRRFDPVARLLSLLSSTQLLHAAWALLRALTLLGALVYIGAGVARSVLTTSMASLRLALPTLGHAALLLGLRIAALGLLLGAIDLAYRRFVLRVQLRMTRREVDEEAKESYGAPELHERRRRLRREIAAGAELSALANASLLLLDGHSRAIALGFDRDEPSMAAPRLLAKGQGALCLRMQLAAARAGVPERIDASLVAGLFALELSEEIPRVAYERVASLLRDDARPAGEAP